MALKIHENKGQAVNPLEVARQEVAAAAAELDTARQALSEVQRVVTRVLPDPQAAGAMSVIRTEQPHAIGAAAERLEDAERLWRRATSRLRELETAARRADSRPACRFCGEKTADGELVAFRNLGGSLLACPACLPAVRARAAVPAGGPVAGRMAPH